MGQTISINSTPPKNIINENHNIGVMEQEKDSLKQTVAQMKATIESLQKTQSKQVKR